MRKITKPDTNNTDPKYWERVLKTHGLDKKRLGLEEPEEVEQTDEQPQFIPIHLLIEAENE